ALVRGIGIVAVRRGQEIALLVDDGHLTGGEIRHARGHQIDDGLNLLGIERRARLQLYEHRGARGPVVTDEYRLPRLGQIDPGPSDRLQTGDGARELQLQRVLVAHVLHELAHAEAGALLQGGEAVVVRDSLAGELQARLVQTLGRNLDAVGSGVQLVGDLRPIQGLGYLRLVLRRQVGVEETVGGTARPEHDPDAGRDGGCDPDQD